MTVSSSLSQQTFNCDGLSVVFTCPFRVLSAEDLRGFLIVRDTGSASELVNGVDFTVSGVGDTNAIVTMGSARSSAYQLKFQRRTARLQPIDYRDNDPFPAESHENGLDRLTHIVQELDGVASRSILVPEPEVASVLPSAPLRAGRFHVFDEDGDSAASEFTVDQLTATVAAAQSGNAPSGTLLATESVSVSAGDVVITLASLRYVPGVNALWAVANGFILTAAAGDFTEDSSSQVTLAQAFIEDTAVVFMAGKFVASGLDAASVSYTAAGDDAAPISLADKLALIGADLEDFGGAADGTTDNLPAYEAAIAAGAKIIHARAAGQYRFSAGITIPPGVVVEGGVFLPNAYQEGTSFVFDLSVATCVTLGGSGANNRAADITRVLITRAAGSIPSGSVGLLVQNVAAADLVDLHVTRHAIPVVCRGDGTVYGITANFSGLYTGAATDTHLEVDTFPEVRVTKSRFGTNGAIDQVCNSYVRVKGGSTVNAANGPNTLSMSDVQFNQGANYAATWIDFKNVVAGNIADLSQWMFDNVYIEAAHAGIRTDSTWTSLYRLQLSNSTFNGPSRSFFDLNAATQIDNWTISNSIILGSLALAPTPQFNFLTMDNVQVLGLASFTSASSGSVASLSNCNFQGGLTLAGPWNSLQVKGGAMSGGTLTLTATSPVGGASYDFFPANALNTFTPSLQFGGTAVGMAYSVRSGAWSYDGNRVRGQLRITLTAKGSSTGTPTIVLTGLPAVSTAGFTLGNSGSAAYAANMASLSSPLTCTVGTGPVINLAQHSATGVASVSEANFTDTSDLAIEFEYYV